MAAFFTWIQIIALVILIFEVLYISLQNPSHLQVILLLLTISTFLMMIGYLFEIKATDLDSAMYGTMISYVGKPLTMFFAFLFIIDYCGISFPKWARVLLALYHTFWIVLVLHNSYFHLFYSSVGFDRTRAFSPLVLSHAPLYYVYMVTIFAYLFVDMVISIHEYRKSSNAEYHGHIFFINKILSFAEGGNP